MSTWTARAHELRATQARILADILRTLDPDDPRTLTDAKHIGSPAGDEQKLRGIPVVGAQGVSGTMHDTQPLRTLISRQPKDTA